MHKILFLLLFIFFPKFGLSESNIDQWQDLDKTYKDIINEGFQVKAYDITSIKIEGGFQMLLFVTVLQKNSEVVECQEYQTIDQNLQTLDLSIICRKLVQPFQQGVGT